MRSGKGFIAALDQSGGSTPKALALYGIPEDSYAGEEQMFDLVHRMRTRIIKSPAFASDRILAAILFEQTMDRTIDGLPTAEYLWQKKGIVPILKVDKGLAPLSGGVRLMKPIDGLSELLDRAVRHGVFGTKMRSVILKADAEGISKVVEQQFSYADTILRAGLVPIIEPEVDITIPDKAAAESLLRAELIKRLDRLDSGVQVMLKLSIPSVDDFYTELIKHPHVMRVVALSGGYDREEADRRLARNHGLIASFSRALSEGLSAGQTDAEFDELLEQSVTEIYKASVS